MTKKSSLMRVHVDFKRLVERAGRDNNLSHAEVTRLIPKLLEGKEFSVVIKRPKRGRPKTFFDGLV